MDTTILRRHVMPRPTPGNWYPAQHSESGRWSIVTDHEKKLRQPPDAIAFLLQIRRSQGDAPDLDTERMNAKVLAESKAMRNVLVKLKRVTSLEDLDAVKKEAEAILAKLR